MWKWTATMLAVLSGCYQGVGVADGKGAMADNVFVVNRITGDVCVHHFTKRGSAYPAHWLKRTCGSTDAELMNTREAYKKMMRKR